MKDKKFIQAMLIGMIKNTQCFNLNFRKDRANYLTTSYNFSIISSHQENIFQKMLIKYVELGNNSQS